MRKCWSFIPDGRPSFSEIKQNLDEMLSSDEGNTYHNLNEIPTLKNVSSFVKSIPHK